MPPKRKYTPAQRIKKLNDYNKEYKKKHYSSVTFHLNAETCQDVIAKLDSVPNKVDYIVRLIRADICANGYDD